MKPRGPKNERKARFVPSIDQERKSASLKSRLGTIVLILTILLIALSGYLYLWCKIQGQPLEKIPLLGQVGDAMGPLTGFFSTLALGAAIWSVTIQRRELELQREEMRLIRFEHQESREVMQKQEAAQARQADLFEKANHLASQANQLTLALIDVNRNQTNFHILSLANQISIEKNKILSDNLIAIEKLRHNPHIIHSGDTASIINLQEQTNRITKEFDHQQEELARLLVETTEASKANA